LGDLKIRWHQRINHQIMKYLVSRFYGDIGGRSSHGYLRLYTQLLKAFSFEDMCHHIRDTSERHINDKEQMSKNFEDSSIHRN
jgi:hypothetical protein